MGVGKKKKLAKTYAERTDISRDEELGGGTTLGTKDVKSSVFIDCEQTDDGVSISAGRRVLLIDMKGSNIAVFLGSREVGFVSATGSALLRERFAIGRSKERSLKAVVMEKSEFNASFTVKVG